MSASKALIVSDDIYDEISQLKNQMKKPHQKTDDHVLKLLIDSYKNRSIILQEEIEEQEHVVCFPSLLIT